MFAQQKTVLMMAGGTGGHIFPALAIADEITKNNYKIIWLGTRAGLESRLVPKNGYAIEYIDISGLRGKGLISLLTIPFKLIKAIIQTFVILKRVKPVLSIGMGGFVTGPGGLVSWMMRKPLVIHEQNAISGMSNNILSLFAKQKLCAFPNAFKGKWNKGDCVITGNPVRKELINIADNSDGNNNLDKCNKYKKQVLNILVVGGSLGAQRLNEIVPICIDRVRHYRDKNSYSEYAIKHQCGKGKLKRLELLLEKLAINDNAENDKNKINYTAMEFIDDMAQAYHWADLVICRAGALTISEIACMAKPSILIPYPYAVDDHQTENAKYLSDNNAGFLLAQSELNEKTLHQLIKKCTPEKLAQMSVQAKKLAKPNATKDVTQYCLSWITGQNEVLEVSNV